MGMPVTVKGQVTIPKPLRDHLGLTPGSEVDFILDAEGRVLLQRAAAEPPAAPSRFARARGFAAARNGLSTEAIMALTRDDATSPG